MSPGSFAVSPHEPHESGMPADEAGRGLSARAYAFCRRIRIAMARYGSGNRLKQDGFSALLERQLTAANARAASTRSTSTDSRFLVGLADWLPGDQRN